MGNTLYLKDLIKMTDSGVLTGTVKQIGSIQKNKNDKEFRKVTFFFPSTGKEFVEGIFEFNFNGPRGNLVGMKPGDTVEMKMDGDWVAYKLITTTETTTNQSQSNGEQVKSERAASDGVCQNEEKQVAIQLNGLFQAYVSSQSHGPLPQSQREGLIAEALSFAVAAREAINRKAHELYTGIPPLPTHSPEKIAEVNAAFDVPAPEAPFTSESYNG